VSSKCPNYKYIIPLTTTAVKGKFPMQVRILHESANQISRENASLQPRQIPNNPIKTSKTSSPLQIQRRIKPRPKQLTFCPWRRPTWDWSWVRRKKNQLVSSTLQELGSIQREVIKSHRFQNAWSLVFYQRILNFFKLYALKQYKIRSKGWINWWTKIKESFSHNSQTR